MKKDYNKQWKIYKRVLIGVSVTFVTVITLPLVFGNNESNKEVEVKESNKEIKDNMKKLDRLYSILEDELRNQNVLTKEEYDYVIVNLVQCKIKGIEDLDEIKSFIENNLSSYRSERKKEK